jgi:hypothetical protein
MDAISRQQVTWSNFDLHVDVYRCDWSQFVYVFILISSRVNIFIIKLIKVI